MATVLISISVILESVVGENPSLRDQWLAWHLGLRKFPKVFIYWQTQKGGWAAGWAARRGTQQATRSMASRDNHHAAEVSALHNASTASTDTEYQKKTIKKLQ